MKLVVAILCLGVLCVPLPSEASCSSHTRIVPQAGQTLPLNGRILLEEISIDGDHTEALRTSDLFLVGVDDRIRMKVERIFVGQVELFQALLVPERQPKSNTLYMLKRIWGPKKELRTIRARGMNAVWLTGKARDDSPPRWRSPPVITGHKIQKTGGSKLWEELFVAVDVADENTVLILATITNFKQRVQVTTLLRIREGRIELGNNGCTGPINLQDGAKYQVQLVAVDLSGNQTPAPAPPLEFTWPPD